MNNYSAILSNQTVLSFKWQRTDGGEVLEHHIEALNEKALDRINEMISEGFVEGELIDNIRMTDDDPEAGVSYSGSWKSEIARCEVLEEDELAYVKAGGGVCPNCKSENIEGRHIDADGPQAFQKVGCLDCGTEWKDVYRLAGYTDLEIGDE